MTHVGETWKPILTRRPIPWQFKVAKIPFKSSDVCPESCARACFGVFECKAVERASRALGAGLDPKTNLSEVWTCWQCNWQPGSVALMAQGWLCLGPAVAAAVCVAGVALGDIDLHFAWQAWHLATSTVTLLGRRGTYGTGLALVARLVLVCRVVAPAVCVAGVALGDIDLHFVLQAWHVWHWVGSGGALGSRLPPVDVAAVCVAGVALGDIDLHFAWQA